MSKVAEYLAGERLDDVALYLTHEYLDSQGKLPNMGVEVENGYVLVVPGDDGRRAFAAGTGMDAMEFAQTAMGNDGDIDDDLSGGTCPEAAAEENHEVKFIFSFAEAQNEEVGGIYEEGDVVHAYAKCTCGTTYSDRWVVDDA
ncbi:DUF5807 family protein [Haloferax volcanii]|uniref:Uncharacterized protein n=1 Tax=Haloferax volcanii TaxID=2246 RepID=A0A558G9N0_HALVO|nr:MULTISPECIES: DUF5807 family protein [Haloferax]NLV03360.1 hypothetical protein [Haloferax alexandrinus]TVT94465.1 hypothetical protein FQA18_11755 [Haloferax volcanii]